MFSTAKPSALLRIYPLVILHLGLIGGVSGQVALENVRYDVTNSVAAGSLVVSATTFDIGSVNSIFDGSTSSLARTPNISPAFVQLAYSQNRTFRRFRVYLSYGSSYQWWIEKADTQADMDGKTGSWGLIMPTNSLVSGNWGEYTLPSLVSSRLVRLNVRRFGGDNYCHINEWELYGDVVIDRIDVVPTNAPALFVGDTRSFSASGHNNAANENYFPLNGVTWTITGNVGTISSNGVLTVTNAGTGTIYASIGGLSSTAIPITVQPANTQNDIDVLYIERTPRLAFDPADRTYSSGLPTNGQPMVYLAHVKNWGTSQVTMPFEWWFDGALVSSGKQVIDAGQRVTVPFPWSWQSENHDIEFRADPEGALPELSKLNNRRAIRSNALLVGLWVEQGLYNYFHHTQYQLNDGANSFEDWGQRMVDRWNRMMEKAVFPAAPNAFLDRVALDQVIVVPDDALPLNGGLSGNNPDSRDRTVDMQWGYPWNPNDILPGQFYGFRWNGPFYIDFGSIHEMNHARYHIDLYALDMNQSTTSPGIQLTNDAGAYVAGTTNMPLIAWDVVYYNKWRDVMGAGPSEYDAFSAGAWNWKHHRRGRGNMNAPSDLGAFLNDLPSTNHVQFVDQTGQPLPGASVEIYRATGGFYNKFFDGIADASYTTDAQGFIHLGRNPFGATTNFGSSLPDVIFKVRYRGIPYWMFQEVTDFNLQYWLGNQEQAFYVRPIDLKDNRTVVPTNSWLANYFNGLDFGNYVTSRVEATNFDFNWSGAPAQGVDAENYSVYFASCIQFTEGWKKFNITSDGGIRLFMDGRLVFDAWTNTTQQSWSPVLYTQGSAPFVWPGRPTSSGKYHRVEVRYRHQAGSARLQLNWADEAPPEAVPAQAWRADYYSTKTLNGYMHSRLEAVLNNDYQNGSPDPVVGTDTFSARWTGDWDFPAGNSRFTAVAADGMRVWIDGTIALDKWFDQSATTYTFTRNLSAGRHRIVVEYYESASAARAALSWINSPTITRQPADQTNIVGGSATFAVDVSGPGPLIYQWRFNGNALAGKVQPTLTLTNLQYTNAGPYSVSIANPAGSVVSSNATLVVLPAGDPARLGVTPGLVQGEFQYWLQGSAGSHYAVESSSNLVHWEPVMLLTNYDGGTLILRSSVTNWPQGFFRATLMPENSAK